MAHEPSENERLPNQHGGQAPTENEPQPKNKLLILLVATLSFALWQMADHFTGFFSNLLHCISVCSGLADAAYAIPASLARRKYIWISYSLLCLIIAWAYFRPSVVPKPPVPHILLSLQIGDSSDSFVFLTNEFLFRSLITKDRYPNGLLTLSNSPPATLVIPMQPGESNKSFTFSAWNDSPVTIPDLQIMVGFPINWRCNADRIWRKVKV